QAAVFDEGAKTLTQHDCAPASGISTAANVYISGTSALNSAGGTIAAGAGYARVPSGIAQVVFLDQRSALSVAGTRGDYTSSIPGGGCGCLVSYKTAGSGSGGGSTVAPKKVQSIEKNFSATSASLGLPQNVAGGNLLTVQIAQWDANGGHRTAK